MQTHSEGPSGPKTRTWQFSPLGITTNLIVTEFVDRFFVVLTQNGKIGSLIHCSKDASRELFDVLVMSGDRQKHVLEVYARKLGELLCVDERPLVVGITILDESPAMFKAVAEMLSETLGADKMARERFEFGLSA
eukprot:Polyplicarium_translucidae@DN464_c0_g1_i2.p1